MVIQGVGISVDLGVASAERLAERRDIRGSCASAKLRGMDTSAVSIINRQRVVAKHCSYLLELLATSRYSVPSTMPWDNSWSTEDNRHNSTT